MLVSWHVLTNTQHLLECEATKYTLKYKSEVLHTKLHSSLAKISQSGINQEATMGQWLVSTLPSQLAVKQNSCVCSDSLTHGPLSKHFLWALSYWSRETFHLVYQVWTLADLKRETMSSTAAAEPQLRGGLKTITASNHPSTDTTWGNWTVPPIFCLKR